MKSKPQAAPDDDFAAFARELEPRLRSALVAVYGFERGREAAMDGLAHAWERWEHIRGVDNPGGYVYRIAQRYAARGTGRQVYTPVVPDTRLPWVEPRLTAALEGLTMKQRQAVVLVEGLEWSQREAADLLGVSASTVQRHLERGMAKLRKSLGVEIDV